MIAEYLAGTASSRFFCEKLCASLSLEECVLRQTRPPRSVKAGGKVRPWKFQPARDVFCRSGQCTIGKENVVKLEKKRGRL
jgi:hypothetical protein